MDYNFISKGNYSHNYLLGKKVYLPNIDKGVRGKIVLIRHDEIFVDIERTGTIRGLNKNKVLFIRYTE